MLDDISVFTATFVWLVKVKAVGRLFPQAAICMQLQIVPLQSSMQELVALHRIPPNMAPLQVLVEAPTTMAPPLTPPALKEVWAQRGELKKL
jgi:hypothetical protein